MIVGLIAATALQHIQSLSGYRHPAPLPLAVGSAVCDALFLEFQALDAQMTHALRGERR